MSGLITKPTIIITSLGRTGTTFFSVFFRELIPNCTSIHEADYLTLDPNLGPYQRARDVLGQIREAGLRDLVVNKSLGRRSLRHVSDARVRGDLRTPEAARKIVDRRHELVHGKQGTCYIEASSAFYGLIDILPEAFTDHRLLYILRDGRDWIRSSINSGGPPMHNRSLFRRFFSPDWPAAKQFPDDPYFAVWDKLSRFEKMCWAWSRLNEYALDTCEANPCAHVHRFEDLFKSQDKHKHFERLVEFTTSFLDPEKVNMDAIDILIDRKIYPSKRGTFPHWTEWTTEHRQQFKEICGELMERAGYEL